MANINLADTNTRWRWRRNAGSATIKQMMIDAKDMLPDGTFTDTLLQFTALPVELPEELPEEAKKFFPQGLPDPALGMWYRGTAECGDKYVDPLDNNESLGIFWAKLWEPTPPPPEQPTNQQALTILLFQYGFAVPKLMPINKSGVRIFIGYPSKDPDYTTSFYGRGYENWIPDTFNTFTLTPEPWPQQ